MKPLQLLLALGTLSLLSASGFAVEKKQSFWGALLNPVKDPKAAREKANRDRERAENGLQDENQARAANPLCKRNWREEAKALEMQLSDLDTCKKFAEKFKERVRELLHATRVCEGQIALSFSANDNLEYARYRIQALRISGLYDARELSCDKNGNPQEFDHQRVYNDQYGIVLDKTAGLEGKAIANPSEREKIFKEHRAEGRGSISQSPQ